MAGVPKQPFVSVALTTIGNEPVCVGVPERCPVEAFSVRPVGSVLAVDQVAVPRMPLTVKVWSKDVPSVPVVVPGFVTVIVWQAITSVYVARVPVQPFASVALTTIGNEPVWLVVPERTPALESVRPVGSVLDVENVTEPLPPDW